ncbi:thymidylate kinase [Erysipelotrichaceae bacterium]|nr:thymidylate kinase [Erysipelotrichaceae bacterium]
MEQTMIESLQKFKDLDCKAEPLFFSFEGGEGSGKSTVLHSVGKMLSEKGYDVLITREPGGNSSGMSEEIRTLILSDKMAQMSPLTEAFLYAASRTQHIQEVIKPALQVGKIVLTDRYVDSSLVYQGLVWGNLAAVATINFLAIAGTMPATTLFFDVAPEIALVRVFAQRQEEINHLDKREISFHQDVYNGFKMLRNFFPQRYQTIDATRSLNLVIAEVYQCILSQIESGETSGNHTE